MEGQAKSKTDKREDTGHLYVLEFANGLVKVGRSTCPASRIADHDGNGRVHGNPVVRQWTSDLLSDVSTREQELIARCRAHATETMGAEWFRGVAFGLAVDHAVIVTNQHAYPPEVLRDLEQAASTIRKYVDPTFSISELSETVAVRGEEHLFKGERNQVSAFAAECLLAYPGGKVPSSWMYEAYKKWCGNEQAPLKQKAFKELLERTLASPAKRTSKGTMFCDVAANANSLVVNRMLGYGKLPLTLAQPPIDGDVA